MKRHSLKNLEVDGASHYKWPLNSFGFGKRSYHAHKNYIYENTANKWFSTQRIYLLQVGEVSGLTTGKKYAEIGTVNLIPT